MASSIRPQQRQRISSQIDIVKFAGKKKEEDKKKRLNEGSKAMTKLGIIKDQSARKGNAQVR